MTLRGLAYAFPSAVVTDGCFVYVLVSGFGNKPAGVVRMVLPAPGQRYATAILRDPSLSLPSALAVSGGVVYVVSPYVARVTELNASTGRRIRVLARSRTHLENPQSLAIVGGALWVLNATALGRVSGIDPVSGAVLRVIS